MQKTMVFYQPIYDPQRRMQNSGTVLRPYQMKEAFKNAGYELIDIQGSFENRKKLTDSVMDKDDIAFIYCESANSPLCFSGRSHLDFRPFADLINLKKLSKKAKIGLYYRDIFWRESVFSSSSALRRSIIIRRPEMTLRYCDTFSDASSLCFSARRSLLQASS